MKKSKRTKRKSSLEKGRSKRRATGDGLMKRVRISKKRAKGLGKNVLKPGLDIPMYRPGDGGHIIDIIPYITGKNDPVLSKGKDNYTYEYYCHRNVGIGDLWFICLAQTYGKPCPICEHRDKLREKGASKKTFKPLFPQRRNMYNVVSYDRGEERKGVQLWDVPWFYSEKHIQAIAIKTDRRGREKETNFAHSEKGKSIQFTIEPPKGKEDYASYEGWSFEDRDYVIKNSTLDGAHVIDQIVYVPSYKELKEAYWKGKSHTKDDDDSDMDEKFQELMDEVEDLEEMEDLEEFIEENELQIKVKKSDDEDDVKEKIKEALEEQYSYEDIDDDDDDDFDDDDDDDDFDDDDDDDDDDEPKMSKKDIKALKKKIGKMNEKQIQRYIKKEDIDVDTDDADDLEDLREMVLDSLGI